ncbi:hypothetical protein GUJ93_ZPchr0014g47455 [Zizania palustris]|uniref:Uncharacterized protein n=1 Tax=Zizania palustris TaxID=103762 RepID=A0A8J5TFR8_ZIZPA|nr:hypothetical protein GUJ93_ZPchr0014g47455 [Zizania palustris]
MALAARVFRAEGCRRARPRRVAGGAAGRRRGRVRGGAPRVVVAVAYMPGWLQQCSTGARAARSCAAKLFRDRIFYGLVFPLLADMTCDEATTRNQHARRAMQAELKTNAAVGDRQHLQ